MKNKKILFKFLLLTLILLLPTFVLSGCGGGSSSPSTSSSSNVVIPSTTKVLSDSTLSTLIAVSKDDSMLVFSGDNTQLQSLSPGDVIVVGQTNLTPFGLLRKVTNISYLNGTTALQTIQATLTDEFQSVNLQSQGVLAETNVKNASLLKGVTLIPSKMVSGNIPEEITLDANNACLSYNSDNNGVDSSANCDVYINGTINLNLNYNINIIINNFSVSQAYFIITPTITSDITTDSTVTASVNYNNTIARIPLTGIIIMAGFVPVYIDPVLEVNVGFDGKVSAKISTGATVVLAPAPTENSLNLDGYGVDYNNGSWSVLDPALSLTNWCVTLPTASANASGTVYAGPQLNFLIYGVAGTFVNTYGDLKANISTTTSTNTINASLFAGLEINGGAEIQILDDTVASFNANFLNYQYQLYNNSYSLGSTNSNQCPSLTSTAPSSPTTQPSTSPPPPPAPVYNLTGVTYGNGKFVAAGFNTTTNNNTTLTSADGSLWTAGSSSPGIELQDITFGDGTFVGVGDNYSGSDIFTSTDGSSWTPASYPKSIASSLGYDAVTYGNGTFVAVGGSYPASQGYQGNSIITSTDGSSWIPASITDVTYSSDSYQLNSVTYGNGMFVATGFNITTGNPIILTSTSGSSWTPVSSIPSAAYGYELKGVTFGNGMFVAVGSGQISYERSGDIILTSLNGTTWTVVSDIPICSSLNSVIYGAGMFIAVGGSDILMSTNGTTWTVVLNSQYRMNLYSVTYGNNLFVAVGLGGEGYFTFAPPLIPFTPVAALTITSTNPPNGATGVLTNSTITITFNEAMNSSTINSSTFTLTANGTNIPGSVSYNSTNDAATFTPTNPLSSDTVYTATVTTGIESSNNTPLSSNYSWSFTTASGPLTSGNIWVTNNFSNTITELSPSGSPIGTYTVGNGPVGIGIDQNGYIWVANSNDNTVTKLSSSGSLIGTYNAGDGPDAIAINSSGDIWVADHGSNTVTELNPSGSLIGTYTVGNAPIKIAIDQSGDVWVASAYGTVTELSPSGVTIGTHSVGPGASGIAIAPNGNIWVADGSILGGQTDNVTEFSPSGSIINSFNAGITADQVAIDSSGNVWVVGISGNTVKELNSSGSVIGTCTATSISNYPNALTIDSSGNVWVTDALGNTVTELSPSCSVIGTYTVGSDPYYIAVDSLGNNGPEYFSYGGPQWPY